MELSIEKKTKYKILEASLELFSLKGYEATSIKEIADVVGIAKASLYSHYKSKQDILDALIKETMDNYYKHSIFVNSKPEDYLNNNNLDVEYITSMILKHVNYLLHNSNIVKARRLLVIEQFNNEELAKLLTKQNYDDVLNYFEMIIKALREHDLLIQGDDKIMACQLCLPISAWINLCDRESDKEEEVIDLITRHVHAFFKAYRK